MSDWTRKARPEQAAAVERMRAYLTPWPEALRTLGGLQSKRVGAYVPATVGWLRLFDAGAADADGRLTALGAILADEEADRMFRDAFEI